MAVASAAPERIGRFEVLRPLGTGGMGAVYLCRDGASGGHVALKRLREATGEDARLRFRREFRAAIRLDHPRIVRVFELGEDAGRDFYTMEHVEGVDLARAFRERGAALSSSERLHLVVSVVSQIAEALAYLHAARIVHRDLKPENVLVDARWQVKVMDFGLARELETESVRLTQLGTVLGTALYMSPEQAKGLTVDARTDLYALGVMVFELLAGRPPFLGGSIPSILYQHIHEPAPRLGVVCPQVPRGLAQLCEELLAKAPSDRPATAAAVLTRLAAVRLDAGEEAVAETMEVMPAAACPEVWTPAEPRLVGRADALATIAQAVSALDHGEGHTLVCVGPRGAGKSRLLAELRGLVGGLRGRAAAVHQLRAGELSPRPFGAAAALVEQLVDDLDDAGKQSPEVRAAAAILAPACGSAVALVAAGEAARPGDSGDSERLAAATATLVASIAARRPVVWLIDDAHLLDDPSTAAIEAVLREGRGRPLLVALTARAGSADPDSRVLRLLGSLQETGIALPVPALGPEALEELASSMLGSAAPTALVERLVAESRGAPGDAEAIVRALVERGALRKSGIAWALAQTSGGGQQAPSGAVPAVIADLVAERISRLGDDAREVLAYAAVLGREVPFATLALATGLPEDALLDEVDRLIREGFLRPLRGGGSGGERYAFASEWAREVALARLSAARRAALHRRVAEALELRKSSARDAAFDLARHFDAAGDRDRAARFHHEAALLARSRHAHREAAQHLERMEALVTEGATPPPGTDAASLALTRAGTLLDAGDGAAAIAAAEPLRSHGDALVRARADLYVGRGLAVEGEYRRAMQHYLHALENVGRPLPRWVPLLCLGVVVYQFLTIFAIAGFRRGWWRKTLKPREELLLDIYRSAVLGYYFCELPNHAFVFGLLESRYQALGACLAAPRDLAEVHYRHAHFMQILFGPGGSHICAHLERARYHAERTNDQGLLARVQTYSAHIRTTRGDIQQAVQQATDAISLADRHGDPATALLACTVALDALLATRDVPRTLQVVERARELLRRVPDRAIGAFVSMTEAECMRLGGRPADAARLVEEARTAAKALGASLALAFSERVLSDLAIDAGDRDGAIAHAEAGLALCNKARFGWLYHALLVESVARAQLVRADAGAGDAVRRTLRLVDRRARKHPYVQLLLHRLRAELGRLEGDTPSAMRHGRRALELAARLGLDAEKTRCEPLVGAAAAAPPAAA